jgi:hypothetical protein
MASTMAMASAVKMLEYWWSLNLKDRDLWGMTKAAPTESEDSDPSVKTWNEQFGQLDSQWGPLYKQTPSVSASSHQF